mmetsp:Transcript_29901/g.47528  ORF Transcript_29901/g.47528 Transcript_29901/m.47528 type:complete len:246 (-) Transcript_29901:168-905(-)
MCGHVETNYEVHEDIAEFWNSFSSIPIALVAPLGYMQNIVPPHVWVEFSDVKLIFVLIVLIGAGSTYFHSTLSVFGQIMDEMSIIWLTLYSALLVIPPNQYRLLVASAFMRSVFVAFICATTMLGLLLPVVSHIFVLACAPFGLYNHVQAFRKSKNVVAKAKFRLALKFFTAAWACWLTDRFFCSKIQWLRAEYGVALQLHACWHILIAIVAYILIGVCLAFREEVHAPFRAARSPNSRSHVSIV